MKAHATFCQNSGIDDAIDKSLSYLSTKDVATFRKRFRRQRDAEEQFLHTFWELLTGVLVTRQGYQPRYEPEVAGRTPDWLFDSGDARPSFIGEVLTFHIDRHIETEQNRKLRNGQLWCDRMPDNSRRLYPAIQHKAAKYKGLATQTRLPFVVFVYSWLSACLEPDEITDCLYPEQGLFACYPTLTGVCHIEGRINSYQMTHYANPHSTVPNLLLDSGLLPLPIPMRSHQS